MKEITTYNDLLNELGDTKVQTILMECFMTLYAKAKVLDEVSNIVDSDGTIEDIKEVLNGESLLRPDEIGLS